MKTLLCLLTVVLTTACSLNHKEDYLKFDRIPLQSEIENVQPMTGIVLWSNHGRCVTAKDKIQLEYNYMLYNDVCKEKDVYDWTPMDNLLEKVAL